MRSTTLGFLALALGLLTVRTAVSQTLEEPRARQGYWIRVGLNQAGANVIEKGKDKGIYNGFGFSLRLGELVTERLGLGLFVENNGIIKKKDKGAAGGLGIEGTYCPWRTLTTHLGAGFGYVMLTDDATEEKSLRGGAGSYLMLGISYDFFPWRRRLTGGWAFSPALDFRAMPDGNIHTYTVFLSLNVTWWSGLDRNMLNLPDEL